MTHLCVTSEVIMPEEILETPQTPARGWSSSGRNWPRIILAAVLGFGLLAGACYAGYWYGTQQSEETAPVVSRPTPTPSVEDETKSWKTYTSSNFGFEIKYPPHWGTSDSGLYDSTGNLVKLPLLGERSAGPHFVWGSPPELRGTAVYAMYLYVRANPDNLTSKKYVDELIEIGTAEGGSGKIDYEEVREVTINGIPATELYKVFAYDRSEEQIYLTYGDKVYVFSFPVAEENANILNPVENNKFSHLMLPTFKLTPTPTLPIEDQTDGWETYRNEQYGFEFRYPQNFQVTEGLGQYFLNQKPVIELKSESFSYLQNTVDAYFTVSVKSNAKAECEYVPRGVIDTLQNKEINGVSFTMFSVGGAATGNTYSNTILHYLKSTTCYEVVTTIHEASDGNTSDDLSKIGEQKTKLENQLDQTLSTFKFLD